MSVLLSQWSSPLSWNEHPIPSFSALAAPVIPPLDPFDSPFPAHDHSTFSALGAPPPPQPRFTPPQRQTPASGPSTYGVPPKNTRPLDRTFLLQVLDHLSNLLPTRFPNGQQIRLVIHGGAVMLLNDELARLAARTAASRDARAKQRSTTRDIDYIARSFASEWTQRYGVYDANHRLRQCVLETAMQFGLGADWMNSDADVALPMATDPATGALYDPIHAASMQSSDSLTVYTSPNGLLKLVSVTPYWTVALKMVRFNAADREDICILLRSGTKSRGLHWTAARLEVWLLGTAWAMGYASYDPARVADMRKRMTEVVSEANRWDPDAVVEDGRGGVVPLHPGGRASCDPGPYAYARDQHLKYHNTSDPRMVSPFHSPPPSFPPPPAPPPASSSFMLGPAPVPPPPPPPKKKKKKRTKDATAVTTWPNAWTDLPPSQSLSQPHRDPELAERWDTDVWKTAAKEKKAGRSGVTSWLPVAFRKKSSQDDVRDSDLDSPLGSPSDDSDSEDEGWLERQRRRWGTSGRMPKTPAYVARQGVADFMSGALPQPVEAPEKMAVGGHGQHVLPGWGNHGQFALLPSPPHSPPPPPPAWVYPGPYAQPQQRQITGDSAPVILPLTPRQQLQSWAYPPPPMRTPAPSQHHQSPPPDLNQVAAGLNALGLYS